MPLNASLVHYLEDIISVDWNKPDKYGMSALGLLGKKINNDLNASANEDFLSISYLVIKKSIEQSTRLAQELQSEASGSENSNKKRKAEDGAPIASSTMYQDRINEERKLRSRKDKEI